MPVGESSVPTEVKKEILLETRALLPQLVSWRRHLHQHPELSNEEIETTAFIRKLLKNYPVKLIPIPLKTGLLCELNGRHQGPTLAIRTDIDALPVTEQTGLPFASKYVGKMHACGHDMHMTTILGTLILLSRLKENVHGKVRFIFQPAEELPPGGARPMIDAGAIEGVDAILGLHVDPDVPTGKIGLRDGVTMAAVTDFDLIIKGKGGHAAKPHQAVDAIVTAAEIVDSIQKIVSRETDPIEPVVITFGRIEGGLARNVICDRVILTGTARALSSKAASAVPRLIKRVAEFTAKARNAEVEMNVVASYPVLSNTPSVNLLFHNTYGQLFGNGKILPTEQVLGFEDFACYLGKVPGAMFRLGIRNTKIKADKTWHSPHFIADEDALFYGVALLTASTLVKLSGEIS